MYAVFSKIEKRNAKTSESGAEQEDDGGPEHENEGENDGENDGDYEVETQPEIKPELSSTSPEVELEVNLTNEDHTKTIGELNITAGPDKVKTESESENGPKVAAEAQSQPEVESKAEDKSGVNTKSTLDKTEEIRNLEKQNEKPFEMENGIETINIQQIDRQKNENEVNAKSEIDVNVNNDSDGRDGSSKNNRSNLEDDSESDQAKSQDKRSQRAVARDKYGPELRNVFKKVDKDASGYASIDEMW